MDASVARAIFNSSLLRTEDAVPEIRRDDAAIFTKQLLKTLNICTGRDIKACKDFIVRNVTPSHARTAALIKYLLFLSKSFGPKSPGSILESAKPKDEDEGLGRTSNGKLMQPPDAAFKRLHILYVLHDVLCFVAVRSKDPHHARHIVCNDSVWQNLKTHASLFAQLAACSENKPRSGQTTLANVRRVLKLWQKLNIIDNATCTKLESQCEEANATSWGDFQQKLASTEAQAILDEQRRREEERKWMLPIQHHLPNDPSAPWHDLPAANALLQKRVQGYPLRANELPPGGYRLMNGGRQASDGLKADVEELHREALKCFDKYTNAEEVKDVDTLGNIIWKDRPTRNYWGLEIRPEN
ncbi:hypothetical protein Q7P37_002492 [Cladosporium fusiforme]